MQKGAGAFFLSRARDDEEVVIPPLPSPAAPAPSRRARVTRVRRKQVEVVG